MKKLIFSFIFCFTFILGFSKEVKILVQIKNTTNQEFFDGELIVLEKVSKYVTKTIQKIEVNGTESFEITLPQKGKYIFKFKSDDFSSIINYPKRITDRDQTITIFLKDKMKDDKENMAIDLNKELTAEEIATRFEEGNLNFIVHGLNPKVPKEFKDFKEKYGVGLMVKDCNIDPFTFNTTTKNNQRIAAFLTDKFGNIWLEELSFKPFGLSLDESKK